VNPRVAALVVMVPLALAGGAAHLQAQSLGEVAKREAERRGTAPDARKVYTNGDLTPDFTVPAAPVPEPAVATSDKTPSSEGSTPQAAAAAADQPPGESKPLSQKGEDYWRDKANRIRNHLAKQRAQIEAIQRRVNELRNMNDATTENERDLSVRALEKARTDLGYLEDEWSNFEATAKAQKIPEAWIR
jgi:hypothetical protein